MKVLIVEDEKGFAKEIGSFLEKEGYQCEFAYTGGEASEKIFVNTYDFILLDLGLPDYDGFDLLEEAKEAGQSGSFIVLTARGATGDKIKGLNMGADDYLPKPFSLLELASRMNAITRRKHGLVKNTIKIHDFELDIQNRTVHVGKTMVPVTKKEFDLLHYLALHKNKVLNRLQLTEHIWGEILEDDYESNYIDVHIKNLRKKLSEYANCDFIETVRGIGYRISMPE
ncbi:MAG: response regulator transcription factor [Bacteroidota bacterium]